MLVLLSPTPPALTRSPGVPARTRREPHHYCRGAGAGSESRYWSFRCWLPRLHQDAKTQETQERGLRELVDQLRGNFPHPGPRPGSRTGLRAAEIVANCDPSAAPPTRPLLLPLPFQKITWGAHRRSPSPGDSGLGQQRQEPRVVARSRTGSSLAPLILECESGLASLQLWGLRANFLEQSLIDEEPGFAQDGKWLGGPRAGMCYGCFALAEELASRSAWACSQPRGEGQRRCAHLLFPSPRTPQRLSSRSPRAGPVCRRGPGRSGRSWISADWKAAASQSEPGPDPPRCDQRRRVRRLSGTPIRDPRLPLHTRLLCPQMPSGRPTRPLRRPGPTRPRKLRILACPVLPAEHRTRPQNSKKLYESFVWFCAGGKTL